MDIDIVAWAGLALRWFHLMAGIMWIGTSFYFIWLGNALTPAADEKDREAGVEGEVWSVHGGGFYHKQKYAVAPSHMPKELHWFKWEAYLTWLSGFSLLVLVYYYQAHLYLIGRAKMNLTTEMALVIGLVSIVIGWVFYDTLCKTPIGKNNRLFGLVWFSFLTMTAWSLGQIFTGRGMYIHIGAIIGTVMAANVFMVIIPNQKKTVAALLAGQKPDPQLGKKAGQRSLHNNYMTLPVLLIMISNHYPMLYNHPYNWLILAGLSASSWSIREFFNRQDRKIIQYRYVYAGVAGFLLVAGLSSMNGRPAASAQGVSAAEARAIIRAHCSACHSDTPTHAGIDTAPAGAMFDTMEQVKSYAAKIQERVVKNQDMPLGNETNMTPEERKKLGDFLSQLPR